jgi:hypothetical protein
MKLAFKWIENYRIVLTLLIDLKVRLPSKDSA